jgi:uncharacterized protein (DUF2147 family)
MTALASGPAERRRRASGRLKRLGRIVLVVVAVVFPIAPRALPQPTVAEAPVPVAVPQGVWLMDGRVAVQIFECEGLMCGRIVWLRVPRDAQGLLDRDRKNPVPALQQRKLCGLTILWGLRPTGANRWVDGWFYNPDDGKAYSVTAQLKSDDVIVARIYSGIPLFGKAKTLARVAHDTTEGWC